MSSITVVVNCLRALSVIFLFSCCNPMELGMLGDTISNLFDEVDEGRNEKSPIGANSDNCGDAGLTESKGGSPLHGGEVSIPINNADSYASTALHYAVETNKLEIVEELLAKDGIDVNRQDKRGYTALHIAADRGNLKIVKLLLSHADIDVNVPDNKGNIPLHCALDFVDFIDNTIIRYGIVRLLLSHGISAVNMPNQMGETALHMAVATRNLGMVKLLLSHAGVDVNVQDKKGYTTLHHIIYSTALYEIKLEIVEELLSHARINVNVPDNKGNTPLHGALHKGYLKIIEKLLVKDGIDLNVQDQRGDTAWHMVASLSEEKFANADLKRLLAKEMISKIEDFKIARFCELNEYRKKNNYQTEFDRNLFVKIVNYALQDARTLTIKDSYNKTVADLLRVRGMQVEAATIEAIVAKYVVELKE